MADDPWAEFRITQSDPWADFRVAPQPKTEAGPEPSVLADAGEQVVRGLNRGVNAIASLPGALVGGAVNLVAPGQGDRFKWNNPVSEFMSSPQAQPQTAAGRYADSIGQAIGSSVVPAAGVALKARQGAAAAETVLGQIGQQFVNGYRTAPAATLATDIAASTGAGVGQQFARDAGAGPVGEILGGFAGAVAPFGAMAGANRIMDAANRSPTLARYRTPPVIDEAGRPQSAGAAANPNAAQNAPPPISGPEAAAYQHLANKLSAAGVRRGEIGARIERSDIDAVGGTSPLALVDTDNSLQRLAGSVVRQSDEAGNIGQRFVAGRQTGITPLEGMPPESGIPTRQFMERGSPIDPAMGMYERMRDNLRAALQVPNKSAYRVDKDLIDIQKNKSGPEYRAAYKASAGVDLSPVIDTVLQKWTAIATDPQQLTPIAKTIQKAVSIFKTKAGTVSDLPRFQTAKELLDEEIGNFIKSPVGRNRRLGGELNDFKNELLAAVDGITTNKIGDTYKAARNIYSSAAEMRRALEKGREALREGSEVSADSYRAMTAGEQQMFRVGLADAADLAMAGKKRGADVTQQFQSPRVQQLLMEVMPQDSATRLGRNIQTENLTTRTAQEVFGNSKTQQRAADDEAFNQMGDAIETLRTIRSPTEAGFRLVQTVLERVGGFRADTATELAKKLFTADRIQLEEIIKQIEARMGPDRASHFRMIIDHYAGNLSRQGAASAATATQSQQAQQQQSQGAPLPRRNSTMPPIRTSPPEQRNQLMLPLPPPPPPFIPPHYTPGGPRPKNPPYPLPGWDAP